MNKGKVTCSALKDIRKQIAEENEIEYTPTECHYQGECSGTCPKCESEVRYIENQLALRQAAGKTIKIMGMVASMTLMASCNPSKVGPDVVGIVPNKVVQGDTTEIETNPTEGEGNGGDLQVMGEVPYRIDEEEEKDKEE